MNSAYLTSLALVTLPILAPQRDDTVTLRARADFSVCDYDSNGVLIWSEARESLRIDLETFKRAYDLNKDGEVTFEEFESYCRLVEPLGGIRPPIPKRDPNQQYEWSAIDVLDLFDDNLDDSIDKRELGRLLSDYGKEDLDGKLLMRKLDGDLSDRLEGSEIDSLVRVLDPGAHHEEDNEPKKTLEELFGTSRSRGDSYSRLYPDRLSGPVPHFWRLDHDRDGNISLADLKQLQGPLRTTVRPRVLLSLLGGPDGMISEEEFFASMGGN